MKLTDSQTAALEHVRAYAASRRARTQATVARVLKATAQSPKAFADAREHITSRARVVLHFHPDRLDTSLHTVAEGLLESGVYKSQFETGISNGSVSAHPGGERDLWENGLYGGAYNLPGSTPSERPKYGALDLLRSIDGPAPRFGSCYLILSPEVSQRCTFSYLDSHLAPAERGTLDTFDDILGALLDDVLASGAALGASRLTVPGLLRRFMELEGTPASVDPLQPPSRNLDRYIEAQIHGAVRLKDHADRLVADPSFRDTETGLLLARISREHDLELQWHAGFVLRAEDTPSDFRGPGMPSLAHRVAHNGLVDAHAVGLAAQSLRKTPESWLDRGTQAEALQELKQLWHVLVHCGKPTVNR